MLYPLFSRSLLGDLLCMFCPLQLSLVKAREKFMARGIIKCDFLDRSGQLALFQLWAHDR